MKKKNKKNKKNRKAGGGVLMTLMERVGLADDPAVLDVSREPEAAAGAGAGAGAGTDGGAATGGNKGDVVVAVGNKKLKLPAGLELAQLECLEEDKDIHLYYFLLQV